ncbi:MAG: 5'/3'-nucleotidase SurE [Proteobacteria bacterium]|nr:5'/3'-nucleotidase SurE [Pseudomonadota bacterium]
MTPALIRNCKHNSGLYLVALAVIAYTGTASAQTYRILLSNDDGIDSPLLHILQQELAAIPDVEVVVSAPNENKSGSSHSSDGGSMVVERIQQDGKFFGYAVHGRPADAVRFGLIELGKDDPFDLVVSGINRGANVGDVSHLSGTVGAAMEGIYQGVSAIAISQATEDVNTVTSARFAAQLVRRYMAEGAPEDTVISINIPGGELRGVRVMPMGDSYLQTSHYELIEQSGSRSVYEGQRIIVRSTNDATDTYAYQQGYITLTPLKFDWTDQEVMRQAESWNLQLIE